MNNNLDEKLNSRSQMAISQMVASLPEDQPSMVWRSELNEALRATSVKSKKRKLMLNWFSPVAGLSAACLLAVIFIVKPSSPSPQAVTRPVTTTVQPAGASLEASLMNLHQDDVRTSEIAGTGLSPIEAVSNPQTNATDSWDDSEDDIQL